MKNEKINTGNFNEQITWRQPTSSKSTFGDTQRSFIDFKTDWVEVNPVAINENEISNRQQYTETYTFTAHYFSDVNNTWELQYQSEDYNIVKIERLNLNRFIRVTAVKIED